MALILKRHRSFYARPFAKSEWIILVGLEKYVVEAEAEAFREAFNEMIKEEEKKNLQGAWYGLSRNCQVSGHLAHDK